MGKVPGHPLLGSSSTVSAYESNPAALGGVRDNSSGDVSLGGLGLTEEQLSSSLHSFGGLSATSMCVLMVVLIVHKAGGACELH